MTQAVVGVEALTTGLYRFNQDEYKRGYLQAMFDLALKSDLGIFANCSHGENCVFCRETRDAIRRHRLDVDLVDRGFPERLT